MQKQKVLEKIGLSDKGSVIFFGVVCWVTYFSIYLGRLNFSASMSEMAQTGIWGKTQLGSVAAAFYLAYGLGQFPSGVLGDHFPESWSCWDWWGRRWQTPPFLL